MPVITIQQIAGRTNEQKTAVMKKITEVFVDVYGVPGEGVMIIFQDLKDDDWGRNGVLYSDSDH